MWLPFAIALMSSAIWRRTASVRCGLAQTSNAAPGSCESCTEPPFQQVLPFLLCRPLKADTGQRARSVITELHADMMEREETFIRASFLDPPASYPSQNSLEKSNGVSLPEQGETTFNLHKQT